MGRVSDEYERPKMAQHPMGRIQCWWDKNITTQRRAEALSQKKETAVQQTAVLSVEHTKTQGDIIRLRNIIEALGRKGMNCAAN